MSTSNPGEWIWRFLAAAMLFAVSWAVWVIYQLNPQSPLILNPAFEAAAKARVNEIHGEKQSSQGVIAPAAEAPKASVETQKVADAQPAPEAPKEPPINADKLKFSDTIALPVAPNAKK
ncbi:MAG TPA: hypothetical protein VMU46_01585 [Burkholderiales bacterium]|nr:hypothetical protein [Burkholderiales bacterium]